MPTHLLLGVLSALGKGVSSGITLDMHSSLSPVLGLFIGVSRPFGLGERVGMVRTEPPLCAECCVWCSRLMVHFIQATSGKKWGA